MCPRPLLPPTAPVTSLSPQCHPSSAPAARVGRMLAKSKPIMITRPGISQRTKSSEGVPVGPPEILLASQSPRGNVVRYNSSYGRTPPNDFCPRACYHCRQSFVPRGFGHEFCSGECQHSFTYRRHAEQRRLHMEKHHY